MTMSGQNRNLEMDPMLNHADEMLNNHQQATHHLHQQILRYQQAQQMLQDATLAIANAFHATLSDENNPYVPITDELVRECQLHSLVTPHGVQLSQLTGSALQDGDGAYQQIKQSLNTRKTKASDVEYYAKKVQKLTAEYDAELAKGDVVPAHKERLERNIGKMREIEVEYNQQNERLIADMNALWRRRIIQLGPALSTFVLSNQILYQEQAQMWASLANTVRAMGPDTAHNQYLNSAVLIPLGSGYVDNREIMNAAHTTGLKADVVAQQKTLKAEQAAREEAVSKVGGHLETVAQETMIRSEEQMKVMKERFVTERVRLRKVVVTEMVTLTVPVRKERVEIERVPVNEPGIPITVGQSLEEDNARKQRRLGRKGKTTTTPAVDTAGGMEEEEEEVIELILSEERPRVTNEVVPVERVRLRKLRQVRAQQLAMDVQKEQIEYISPHPPHGDAAVVRPASELQNIQGRPVEGFTDKTNQAQVVTGPITQGNVVVHTGPGAIASTAGGVPLEGYDRQKEPVRAEVDDVEGMKRIGYGDQKGTYGQTNTLGMGSSPGLTGSTGSEYPQKEGLMGSQHPYYSPYAGTSTGALPGTQNTFEKMKGDGDITDSAMTHDAAMAKTDVAMMGKTARTDAKAA
jgi:stress response protein YsnF